MGAGGKIFRRLKFEVGGEVVQRNRRFTSDIEVPMNDNEFSKRILFSVPKVPLDATKDPISSSMMTKNHAYEQPTYFYACRLHMS